jgi:hypothetical protein
MRFAHTLTALALFTSSWDVFMVFKLGGSIRFAQFMLLGVVVCASARVVTHGTILWPRGASALTLWTVCQGLLLTQSPEIHFSSEMYILLLFTVITMFAIVQVYGRSTMVEPLMRTYLLSFVFIASFGLFQLVAPILHLGSPFIVQWFVPGVLPRINGFNFEPSFYATYLILGWIMLLELRHLKARIVQGRIWIWLTIIVSLSLFLSTSKTAWVLILAEAALRFGAWLIPIMLRHLRWVQSGRLLLLLPRFRVLVVASALLAVVGALAFTYSRVIDLSILLAGSGIAGAPSHSVDQRYGDYENTMKVIHQHFWIGTSLGGVPASIAVLKGKPVQTILDVQLSWGFPVPVEVFAASGLLTFLPFLWFFLVISIGETRLIRRYRHQERAKWLRALIRALAFEWVALCVDQNLLRVYFWLHVTILMVVAYNLRYAQNVESAELQSLASLAQEWAYP